MNKSEGNATSSGAGPSKSGQTKKTPQEFPDIYAELDDEDTLGPFVSDAVRDQLKVVRKSMKRLEKEQITLMEIKQLLNKVRDELDDEIETVRRMREIADCASQYQNEGYYHMCSDEETDEEEVESPSD